MLAGIRKCAILQQLTLRPRRVISIFKKSVFQAFPIFHSMKRDITNFHKLHPLLQEVMPISKLWTFRE